MSSNKFCVEYAKRGTAGCKKCKQKIEKGVLRLGKIVPNPFSESAGDMKQWYHVGCLFETFTRARASTKKIESPDDVDGWADVQDGDRKTILQHIKDLESQQGTPAKASPAKTPRKANLAPAAAKGAASPFSKQKNSTPEPSTSSASTPIGPPSGSSSGKPDVKDDAFREFRRLCSAVANESSYNNKTSLIKDYFRDGTSGKGFEGDLYLWVRMLLPGVIKRTYNIQSKTLIKLFSQIFDSNQEDMLTDLEKGDVAETVASFFEKSSQCAPTKKSSLSLQDVDEYLAKLSTLTKDADQQRVLNSIATRCTGNDLKMVVRLIKGDLAINAGAKHILDAVHPDAYQAFQASRDLASVIDQVMKSDSNSQKALTINVSLMTPVLPMLAEPCRSIDYAMKKCPNGMYAEIKYDGERVQVHKKGANFTYYSRSLKPVLPHKVAHFKDYIPKAFPDADDLILDSEILLVDTVTGQPLPFGTLGIHKKTAFQDATVCLFVFDCLYMNGETLINRSIKERKNILKEHMAEIPNHIVFSEMKFIDDPDSLKDMITDVLKKGLEGLVLKDTKSTYEPGKRHWLKVKKDYLSEGAMADSADLVVLGAWYGTGQKGGMMSVFLMGCYDEMKNKWCTVTKVHTGHDDSTLDRLQKELDPLVTKISKDPANLPSWMLCHRNLIPDFVAVDPKSMPVWEVTGAEFTKHEVHTADGISVRFPRVTKIRDDKTWKEATSLKELRVLFKKSKEFAGFVDQSGPSVKPVNNSPGKQFKKTSKKENETSPSKQRTLDFFVRGANSSSPNKRKNGADAEPSRVKQPKPGSEFKSKYFPDVFVGVKIYLPPSFPEYEVLKRYFVAHGGRLLTSSERSKATHTIYSFGDPVSSNSRLVDPQWLWDSIEAQRLQPIDKYII